MSTARSSASAGTTRSRAVSRPCRTRSRSSSTCSSRSRRRNSMRVLGISGSLRRDSHNSALLRHAGEPFEAGGAEFEIYDGIREIPAYDEDDDVENGPEAAARI